MARKTYSAKNVTESGPYSHAVEADNFIFLSGQTAMNAAVGENLRGDIAAQTKQCFANLFEVLEAANLTHEDVVKVNVYLTDMDNFSAMNEVYKTFFNNPFPSRTCVAVLALPLGAEVEIELIAKRNG
ncbi:RidA family protein [Bacillus sp. FJAT-22090]|uniref:RidA family protein n=1 Tax=Bacillus sp. FJAT-22090 TaxID=1581038 RepID=UPI0011A03968|nr:Rid family detoxifying hydrolase [Bacillus sp. FJAT-22090]